MRAVEIKHLEVRCAQVKLLCAILVSSPCAYVFYTFFKYAASYSPILRTASSFTAEIGPAQGIRVFQVRLMLHSRRLPHFPQLGRCIKKKKAGRGGVVLWRLSQEGVFIPGYTTEACVWCEASTRFLSTLLMAFSLPCGLPFIGRLKSLAVLESACAVFWVLVLH